MYKACIIASFVCLVCLAGCVHRTRHWYTASDYEAQGRYELARQHYLLALAESEDPESQQQLRYTLDILDRKIQAMR